MTATSAIHTVSGAQRVTVDSRGRIGLPADMRRKWSLEENSELVLSATPEGSAVLYLPAVWDKFMDRLHDEDINNPDRLMYREMLNAFEERLRVDGIGRIALPEPLREYTEIATGAKKGAVLAGQRDHYKLWSDSGWTKQLAKLREIGEKRSYVQK